MGRTSTGKRTARSCYGHLGGKLGNQLFARIIELAWFEPKPGTSTVYTVTEKGYEELAKLGINME